jgi:2-keto-3-deoxy-6-phosphogluconate aldolase
MTDLYVEGQALGVFAKTSDHRRTDFDHAHTKANQIKVGRDSFGRIPGIGSKVHNAYNEHQQACSEGIGSAAEAMAAIAAGVRAVMLNYAGAEGAISDDVNTVKQTMGDVTIRGV